MKCIKLSVYHVLNNYFKHLYWQKINVNIASPFLCFILNFDFEIKNTEFSSEVDYTPMNLELTSSGYMPRLWAQFSVVEHIHLLL